MPATRLYLMRHGVAEPHSLHGDAGRRLTPAGEARIERAASLLAQFVKVDVVWSSPYVRAVATAKLVAEALGVSRATYAALVPGASLTDLKQVLASSHTHGARFVVSHQPNLGRWLRELTGVEVAFPPGTVAALDVDRIRPRGAVLVGLYDPYALDRLAASL